MRGVRGLLVLVSLVLLNSACQTWSKLTSGPGSSAQPSFVELWKVYTHCRSSTDPGTLLIDANQLNRMAMIHPEQLPGLLRPLWPLIQDQPIRLSVDPREMAADCTLRAGQAAAAAGWYDIAINLYQSMLPRYREEAYAYYRSQAESRLADLRRQAAITPSSPASASQNESPSASPPSGR